MLFIDCETRWRPSCCEPNQIGGVKVAKFLHLGYLILVVLFKNEVSLILFNFLRIVNRFIFLALIILLTLLIELTPEAVKMQTICRKSQPAVEGLKEQKGEM
jgi:hypothetical protein